MGDPPSLMHLLRSNFSSSNFSAPVIHLTHRYQSVEKTHQFRGQRWLDGWLVFSKSASKKQGD